MNQVTIEGNKIQIEIEHLIQSLSFEKKREILSWLATDSEVVESVINAICGEDELGWAMGSPNDRQRILERVEGKQVAECLRYNWSPWEDLKQKLKDIRSDERVYWNLYHQCPDDLRRAVFDKTPGISESNNYTGKDADKDVNEIYDMIRDTFKAMQKEGDQ